MNDLTKKHIGKRINELLAENEIMQKELAEHIGVTANTVSYYLSGERCPDIEKLIEIAKYFGVTSDYLLGISDVKTINTDLRGVCEYTRLSETAVEVLHYNLGQQFQFTSSDDYSGVLAETVSLMIEDYYETPGTTDSLLSVLISYPSDFDLQSGDGQQVVDAINNFFNYHSVFAPCNNLSKIIEKIYIEQLELSVKRFKNYVLRRCRHVNDN